MFFVWRFFTGDKAKHQTYYSLNLKNGLLSIDWYSKNYLKVFWIKMFYFILRNKILICNFLRYDGCYNKINKFFTRSIYNNLLYDFKTTFLHF